MKLIDLTNQTFAHWFVESRGPDNQYGHPQWHCRCTNCGTTRLIYGAELKRKPPWCTCNRPSPLGNLPDRPPGGHAPNFKNLTGETFGRWTVLAFAGLSPQQKALWDCECSCPKKTRKVLTTTALQGSPHASCGCWKLELTLQRSRTHGMSKTPTYQAWAGMWKRCTNPKYKDYPYYGGRGITVDPRWKQFETFLEEMGERPGPDYTLDRINNDLGYFKENCHWATRQEQSRNKRDNQLITYNNETKTIAEWAQVLDVPVHRIYIRKWRGWDDVKALTVPFIEPSERSRKRAETHHDQP